MKKIIAIIILINLFSCSKEHSDSLCLKIKVVGYNYCSPPLMGAQILEGPKIGGVFRNYDNVISIFGVDRNRFPVDSVFYIKVRDKISKDDLSGICLDVYPPIVFSKILKIAISTSDKPCK